MMQQAVGAVYAEAARQLIGKARRAKERGDTHNTIGYVRLARAWNRRARNSTTPQTGIQTMPSPEDRDKEEGDTAATTTDNGSKPKPVLLRTARDYSLTVQALESRCEELTKLEKKTSEEGYPRESRVIAADASAIKTFILPQFKAQQELPLITSDKLRAAISEAFRGFVRRHLGARASESQGDVLRNREDHVCDEIARRVEAYGVEIASSAYAAGYSAREDEPEAIAHRSVHSLIVSGFAE